MTTTASLPTLAFDLSAFAAKDRWNAWRAFQSGFFDVAPRVEDISQMRATSKSFWAGESVFGEYQHDACMFWRHANKNDYEANEFVTLMIQSLGGMKGLVGDQHVEMSPERYTLFDVNQAQCFQADACRYFAVDLPYAAIGYDPSKHPGVMQIDAASVVGRMLRGNLEMIVGMNGHVSSKEGHTIGHGFGTLVNALLADNLADEAMRHQVDLAREVAVRRFMEANLRNRDLSAEMIGQAFGLSRAELYQIFEEDGGVKHAIVSKRLQHARTELARSVAERGTIQHIASFWGFSDQAHFSRSFRALHGVKPSDVVGTELDMMTAHQDKMQAFVANDNLTPFVELLGTY